MISGLLQWMDEKGYQLIVDFIGLVVLNVIDWQYLDLNYVIKVKIDQDVCIKCGCCYIVCEDMSY